MSGNTNQNQQMDAAQDSPSARNVQVQNNVQGEDTPLMRVITPIGRPVPRRVHLVGPPHVVRATPTTASTPLRIRRRVYHQRRPAQRLYESLPLPRMVEHTPVVRSVTVRTLPTSRNTFSFGQIIRIPSDSFSSEDDSDDGLQSRARNRRGPTNVYSASMQNAISASAFPPGTFPSVREIIGIPSDSFSSEDDSDVFNLQPRARNRRDQAARHTNTRTPIRRRMLGGMVNRFPRLRLNSVGGSVYSDGEDDQSLYYD